MPSVKTEGIFHISLPCAKEGGIVVEGLFFYPSNKQRQIAVAIESYTAIWLPL